MGEVAQRSAIKLAPEGTLRETPLSRILGAMGLLKANCLLELIHQKLLRRVVLEEGRIQALLSNARDDRFLDWLIVTERSDVPAGPELESALPSLASTPLTAGAAMRLGMVSSGQMQELLQVHLLEVLEENAAWPKCSYKILPGRVQLGDEPRAQLHATAAALALARVQTATRRRPLHAPDVIVSRVDPGTVGSELGLNETELTLIRRCADPVATSTLNEGASASPSPTLSALLAADLLAPAKLAAAAAAPPESSKEALEDVTEDELKRWLLLAESENLAGVIGVQPSANKDVVRSAYYRTVRRFHPDRFREGPLSAYHDRIESVFRLVHEALGVLTDPRARKRWEDRHKRPAAVNPETIAKQRLLKAQRAAAQGRRADAAKELEQGLSASPNHVDMAMSLALLLVGNPRRRSEALATLERLSREQVTRADVQAALALALQKTGRSADAQAALSRAKAIDATNPVVLALEGSPGAAAELRSDPFLAPLL